MKKLLLIMALCVGFIACSSDDDDNPENPVTNIEVPQSSADSPVKSGKTVTIKGNGFTQSSEIWLRTLTKSTANNDVKAEIISVTTTGISFIAPSVSGENSIILKQSGEEYVIGKMYFDDSSEGFIKKRIVKRDFSFNDEDEIFEYSYKDGKLETMLEKMSDGDTYEYKFVYDTDGKLLSVNETDYKTKAKQSDKVFEYKSAQTILVHETYYDGEDNETITLTLNDKGLLVKKESQSDVTEYEYNDSGNITKSVEDGTYVYTYDDKYSYLSNQGLPVWYWVYDANENFDVYAGKNNMITLTEDGVLEDSYKFDYDEDGYPIVIYDKSNNNKKIGEFVYEVVE